MSEEIKKNAQDAELNPEELEKVSGGVIIHRKTVTCPECGTTYPEDWGECPTCNSIRVKDVE